MERQYRALRFIAEVCRYVGLFMIVVAMVCAVMLIIYSELLMYAVTLAIIGFILVAISEFFYVLIDIEVNTRRSAQALENLVSKAFEQAG